ncbi:hypothetical protein ACOMHN_048417 [Nucella lapillus]
MFPQDSHHATVQSQEHAGYVAVGVVGCLLLTLFGCTIFRLCKKRERGGGLPVRNADRRAPQRASESRRAVQQRPRERVVAPQLVGITPNRQQSQGEPETVLDTSGQHLSVSSDSDGGEFQPLTASRSPVQYHILPHNDVSFDRSERFPETSFTESVGGINGNGVSGTVETESAGEPSPETRQADTGTVHIKTNAGDAASVTSLKDNQGECVSGDKNSGSSYNRRVLHTQKPQADPHERERTSPGTEREEMFPQTDEGSDVSGYLATLLLDVSSEDSDITEGERTGGSSSRATDDSTQSFESFSRLQDVKAQAEFSPYHIAWSTPLFPPHPSLQRRHSHKVPAAKKLNMDVAFAKPCDKLPENSPDKAKSANFLKTAKEDDSHVSEESEDMETSGSSGWGLLKPQDVWCRPATAEYRTPRPVFSREKYRSLLTVNEDLEEQQPLFPYSVAQYRQSLKDIVAGSVSEHLYSSVCYPQSFHSSNFACKSFVNESGACRSVSEVSTVGSGSHDEDTPQNLPSSSVNSTIDITIASWSENTHSQNGDWNCSAVSASWPNGDSHSSEDALNNNGGGEPMSGKETSHSTAPPPVQSPQMLFPNTSPTCVPLVEADYLAASVMPSSLERPVQSPQMLFPNTSPTCVPLVEADYLAASVMPSSSERAAYRWNTSPQQLCSEPGMKCRVADNNDFPRPPPQRRSTLSRPKSPSKQRLEVLDNFKVPYPVSSASFRIPRSKSSTSRPLAYGTLLEPGQSQMRKSKTSDSISSSTVDQQHPMSLGSWSDLSAAGSSASRMSLQEPSLTWDNEFTASGRGHDDSLAWEDDPCLS